MKSSVVEVLLLFRFSVLQFVVCITCENLKNYIRIVNFPFLFL